MRTIAIVTGASSGVGAEFVRQFDAAKGGPLNEIWAIGRNVCALEDVAASCSRVPVRTISLDLATAEASKTLSELLDDQDVRVQWLVNSAGFGTFGSFAQVGRDQNVGMVTVNCLALVDVTSVVLPHMVPGSRIINLASIAGVVPQPELATYSATKAFVLELSRLLDHELRDEGIRVVAVCPKFMRTRFLDKPGDEEAARRMTTIGFEDVQRVVSKALRSAVLGRTLCIPSIDMKCAHVAAKVLPRNLVFRFLDILFRR